MVFWLLPGQERGSLLRSCKPNAHQIHIQNHVQLIISKFWLKLNGTECCTVPALSQCAVFFHYILLKGSVQLGNSESVLIQHPYLSDYSPLLKAAGWIGSAVALATHAFRPALLIAVKKPTCARAHLGPAQQLRQLALPVLTHTRVCELQNMQPHLLHVPQAFQRAINLDNPQQMKGRAQEEVGQCCIEI